MVQTLLHPPAGHSLSLFLSFSLTDLALSRLVSCIFSPQCLSSWGYPLDPAEAEPRHHFLFDHFKFTVLYEHSRFLCSTVLYSIELYFHHQTHPQLGVFVFFFFFSTLAQHLDSFKLFMGFSRQEFWSGLPFPSPVGRLLSELATMSHLSWVAMQSMAHSLIELDTAVLHVISWLAIVVWHE